MKRTLVALLCALALLTSACSSTSDGDNASTVPDESDDDSAAQEADADSVAEGADDDDMAADDEATDGADTATDGAESADDAPVTPGTSSDDELAAAFTQDIVESDDTVSAEEAECIGDSIVDEFGGDELRAVGISADTMGTFDPSMFDDGTERAFAAIGNCVDLGEFFAAVLAGGDPVTESCITENFTKDELLLLFEEPSDDISDEYDAISLRLEETCFAS